MAYTVRKMGRIGFYGFLGLLALLAAACGSDDETSATSSVSTTAAVTSTPGGTTTTVLITTTGVAPTTTVTSTTSEGPTSTSPATSTEAPSSATSEVPATTETPPSTLPGEDFDGFVQPGDQLGVMGVAYDDVLNVRAAPGTDQLIVATADPTDTGLVATGRERRLTNSIWYEVTYDGETGWVGSSFVAYVGATDDATSAYLAEGNPTEASTIASVGRLVAEQFVSEEQGSRITETVAASEGDLGEVTFDVVGLGDDSASGLRLHVFVVENEAGDGYVLRTIERTTFCGRGLAGELCV